jgi:hypothetical protein
MVKAGPGKILDKGILSTCCIVQERIFTNQIREIENKCKIIL